MLARTAIAADLEEGGGEARIWDKKEHTHAHTITNNAHGMQTQYFKQGRAGQPADRADNGPKLPSFSLAKGNKKETSKKTPGAPLSSGSVLKVCLSVF